MKRDPALASLSREHHQALFVAQRLRRGSEDDAASLRSEFLDFWASDGSEHFRQEEEILLPAWAAAGPVDEAMMARLGIEHAQIRAAAQSLEADPQATTASGLATLGQRLHDHVRFEERELFPVIEEALSPDELARVAAALDAAEGAA